MCKMILLKGLRLPHSRLVTAGFPPCSLSSSPSYAQNIRSIFLTQTCLIRVRLRLIYTWEKQTIQKYLNKLFFLNKNVKNEKKWQFILNEMVQNWVHCSKHCTCRKTSLQPYLKVAVQSFEAFQHDFEPLWPQTQRKLEMWNISSLWSLFFFVFFNLGCSIFNDKKQMQ